MSQALHKHLQLAGAQAYDYKLNDPYIIEVSGPNALPGETRALTSIVGADIYRCLLDEFISRIQPLAITLNERIHKLSLLGDSPPTDSFRHIVDTKLAPYALTSNIVYADEHSPVFYDLKELSYEQLHQQTERTGQYVVYYFGEPFVVLLDEDNPLEIIRDEHGYVARLHYDLRVYERNIRAFYITGTEN